jgi:hypothetical protein
MRRISNSWAAFNVAAPASGWILAATAASWYRLLVPATSTPELEHSTTDAASRCGLLAFADAMGSSTWRASSAVGNASVDDTTAISYLTDFSHFNTYIDI